MRILHFIPNLKTKTGSNIFQYKPALLRSMAESADVHLLTFNQLQEESDFGDIHIHSITKFVFYVRISALYKIMSDINPDVVHIHACWSFAAYRLHKWCIKNRKQVVLTVDKQLEPWHIRHRYWLCKLPALILFQRQMIKEADALHAVTHQEEKDLIHLGWHPKFVSRKVLNGKTCLIGVFSQIASMSVKDMSEAMLRLYRKVLDSRPFMSMAENEIVAEDILLFIGMSQRGADIVLSDEKRLLLKSLDDNSWRRIFLHAADEGILSEVKRGCNMLSIFPPAINVDAVDRFSYYAHRTVTNENIVTESNIGMPNGIYGLSGAELDICSMLTDVLSKLKHSLIKRADFVNLYKLLQFNDYNEMLLAGTVHELKIEKHVARLFQILKERYGLGEGFMFLEPLSDRKTKQLIKKLFKSDIQ